MSELWSHIEAVGALEVIELISKAGKPGHKAHAYLAVLIKEGALFPYANPFWLDEGKKHCRARSFSDFPYTDVKITLPSGIPYGPETKWQLNVEFLVNGAGEQFGLDDIYFDRANVNDFFGPSLLEGSSFEGESMRQELYEAKRLIKQLEDENKMLRKSGNGRATKRDDGRDQGTAKRWKRYMTTAVKMALEIASKPDKEYTNRELGEMAESYGSEWIGKNDRPGTPLEVFKGALPSIYHKGPGAPKQGED